MTTELDVLEWSKDRDLELAYKLGLEKPNYPMPAIQGEVDIGESFVCIELTNQPNHCVMFQRGHRPQWDYFE